MKDRGDETRDAWQHLGVLATETVRAHLRDLADDPARFASMSLRMGPLLIDFSRQRATAAVVTALVAWRESDDWSRPSSIYSPART